MPCAIHALPHHARHSHPTYILPRSSSGSVRCARVSQMSPRGPSAAWAMPLGLSFIPLVIHPTAAAKATAGAARRRFRGFGAAAEVRPEPLGDLVDATVDCRVHLGDALESNPDGLTYLMREAISMQSACNQHAISMQSACNQHAISMQSFPLSPTPMVSRTCDSVASSYARMSESLIWARSRLVVIPLTWSRFTMSSAAKSCS